MISTAEMVLRHILRREPCKEWVDWAVAMLEAGRESPSLLILAGESAPFQPFEMNELLGSALDELSIPHGDRDAAIQGYAAYLLGELIEGRRDSHTALKPLQKLCIELDEHDLLGDFYDLCYAWEDLQDKTIQMYWPDSTQASIDADILQYAQDWLSKYHETMKA